jgi:hypothetical protein
MRMAPQEGGSGQEETGRAGEARHRDSGVYPAEQEAERETRRVGTSQSAGHAWSTARAGQARERRLLRRCSCRIVTARHGSTPSNSPNVQEAADGALRTCEPSPILRDLLRPSRRSRVPVSSAVAWDLSSGRQGKRTGQIDKRAGPRERGRNLLHAQRHLTSPGPRVEDEMQEALPVTADPVPPTGTHLRTSAEFGVCQRYLTGQSCCMTPPPQLPAEAAELLPCVVALMGDRRGADTTKIFPVVKTSRV